MKKRILLIICLGLLLAGCGETETAPLPTDTPIPPTDTPVPTATSTPLPTPTPRPTLMPLSEYIEQNNLNSLAYLIDVENVEFNDGYYRWAIGLTNVMIDNWAGDYAELYLLRSESYIAIGDYEQGIADLEYAYQLPPSAGTETHASMLNDLCWQLGLSGEPEQALPYCEEAVAFVQVNNSIFVPLEMVLDSRGIVYGSLGMFEEAVADFQVVVDWLEENPGNLSPEMTALRQEWLAALENGDNPFTPEVLEMLRNDEIDSNAYPEPNYLEDYSRDHFVNILENDGFVLVDSGVNDSGFEYVFYGLVVDDCMIRVIVFGPEEGISEAKMMLSGCAPEQYIPEFRWFVRMLLFENPREDVDCILMGEYYAWELLELQPLIDGDIEETIEFKVGALSIWAIAELDSEGKPIYTLYGW